MKTKQKMNPSWTRLGGTPAGTISSLVIAKENGLTIFAGARAGLYRCRNFIAPSSPTWERLADAPLGVLCLAISPTFSEDRTVIAGTDTSIYTSQDGGDTWQPAHLPLSKSTILSISASPDFAVDGILLAGTLEDGIFYSDDRGNRWSSKSFGLLDLTVFCLAVSPYFTRDGKVFCGTDTAIYYSYNHARAWKQLPFPETAAPVLSLALSPEFPQDQILFAGTESQGLYRSADLGKSWERLEFPAACINALSVGDDLSLLVGCEEGVFQSKTLGASWQHLLDMPNTLGICSRDGLTLSSVYDQGLWSQTSNEKTWQPIANLSTRSMLGLSLSPKYEDDGTAYLYGPQEGLWKSKDGCQTWSPVASLPDLDISNLVISPASSDGQDLVATSLSGIYLSQDGGDNWQTAIEKTCEKIAFSPNGKILAVSLPGEGMALSKNQGKNWETLPGPWQASGRVLAMAMTNQAIVHVAFLEGNDQTVSLWQGKSGEMLKVHSQEVGKNPVVSIWVPPEPTADRPWFASLGDTVWQFSSRREGVHAQSILFEGDEQPENIIALTGMQTEAGLMILACSGLRLYRLQEPQNWSIVQEFGSERAVSIAISPDFAQNHTVYTLFLGGTVCRMKVG